VKRYDQPGFSLIELLIVVAIILIIAAIAIPNFLRSRMAANQAAAVQSLRVVNTAEVTYSSTYGGTYSANLLQLGPPSGGIVANASNADLVDAVLAGGVKGGYNILYTATLLDGTGSYQGFDANADPTTYGTTGTVYYFTDQRHVIRVSTTGSATASDSPLSD
jgi:type IV pilus assembly protein PilA